MADTASLIELPGSRTLARDTGRADASSDDTLPPGRDEQQRDEQHAGASAASPEATQPASSPPQSPSPAAAGSPPVAREVARARRGGRLFSAACAVLSLIGAGVALMAPTLRPQAQELARQ